MNEKKCVYELISDLKKSNHWSVCLELFDRAWTLDYYYRLYSLILQYEPDYNMAYKAQQKLMLVDGIPLAQQPYNMGNMLWGLKMHRLGFSLPECLFGAHAYTIFGGMTGKYTKIELDSFDDQCSIILGFMLWPGF